MLRNEHLAVAMDAHDVGRAILPALDTWRAKPAMIHDERGPRLAPQQLHLVVHTKSAAMLASAARAFAQGEAPEQDRIILLHHLHRSGLGNADGRAAIAQPIMQDVAAITTTGNLIHHVSGVLDRIEPAEREIARRACRRCRDLVGDGLCQRKEHGFRDALGDFRRAAGHGPRIARIKKCSLRPHDLQWLEGAGIERRIGEDVAHGQIHSRICRRHHRVHRATARRRRTCEIKRKISVLLGDLQCDPERLVDHAIRVDERFRRVDAIGDTRDMGAHQRRRTQPHFSNRGQHGACSITRDQFGQPRGSHFQRRRLRLDVADALIGNADVAADDGVDLAVHHPALEQLDGRQAQSFLLDLGGLGGKPARHHAADVRPVPRVLQPAEQLAIHVERHGEAHIHQVRATQIGVVDDVDVIRLGRGHLPLADQPDDLGGGILHCADEHRQAKFALRDQRAVVGRIDARRAVIGLRDHRRKRRAREGNVHLVANLREAGLNHRDGKPVGFGGHASLLILRFPISSTSACQPGSMMVVASICWTTAGPETTAPSGNISR